MAPEYDRALHFEPGEVTVLSTELANPTPFFFGRGLLAVLPARLSEVLGDEPVDRIVLVSDPTVHALYGGPLHEALREIAADLRLILVPGGECVKSFSELETLCEGLVAIGATKRSVIVALGGGSVGNLVGLAAGMLFRGVRFVEIPTSFTHMTDGTLSNKQAVNGSAGKNLFGLYKAPVMIWGDTQYLETEPRRVRKAGIVEGIKNALIDQPEFLNYLFETLDPSGEYASDVLTELAYKVILSKLEILKRDPSEKGFGIILEYGHTFAHAIEWISRGKLIHGEAVGIGMKIAARLAVRTQRVAMRLVQVHDELIDERLGMPRQLPVEATPETILDTMRADNKRTGDCVRYCLLEELGRCANPEGDFLVAVRDETVISVLRDFAAGLKGAVQEPGPGNPFRCSHNGGSPLWLQHA